MTWVVLIALVIVVFAVMLLAMRKKREGWEAIAAALMVGLAGYALQGHPGVASAPKQAAAKDTTTAADMVQDRKRFAGGDTSQNKWVVIGDALASQGQYADAATILRGAVEDNPKNSDAWLALANVLVGHAQGNLSPAAQYAFNKAAQADPAAPGPAMFMGLAMARMGRFEDTKTLWQDLLARTPADAPWRPELVERIKRLDRIMVMIRQQQSGTAPAAPNGMAPAAP